MLQISGAYKLPIIFFLKAGAYMLFIARAYDFRLLSFRSLDFMGFRSLSFQSLEHMGF